MTKLSVSIGIPVYNEEKNIIILLQAIKSQVFSDFNLDKIIIYNDGSTDKTSQVILSLMESDLWFKGKITFLNELKNLGKSAGLRKIFKVSDAEMLVLLDSDVILNDKFIISKIILPIIEDYKVGLVGGWFTFIKSCKPLRKVLNFSSKVLLEIGKTKKWFVCWGGILCLNSNLIKQIDIPDGLTRIDAYLYLQTILKGYSFVFLPEVRVQDTKDFNTLGLKWFIRIQKRVTNLPDIFLREFSNDFINKEKDLSLFLILRSLIKVGFKNPIEAVWYLIYKLIAKIVNFFKISSVDFLWRK